MERIIGLPFLKQRCVDWPNRPVQSACTALLKVFQPQRRRRRIREFAHREMQCSFLLCLIRLCGFHLEVFKPQRRRRSIREFAPIEIQFSFLLSSLPSRLNFPSIKQPVSIRLARQENNQNAR